MDREDFMNIVYSELADDPDNNRANRIIDAADEYAERRVDDALQVIEELQSAQPEKRTEECTETHGVCLDTISRQQAIDALAEQMPQPYTLDGSHPADEEIFRVQELYADCIQTLEQLPSAQPEIIRCKDCKYARLTNDGSCKYCDIWFPDEAEYMDGDYYCASAERKSNG